jgi:hypothetical protein
MSGLPETSVLSSCTSLDAKAGWFVRISRGRLIAAFAIAGTLGITLSVSLAHRVPNVAIRAFPDSAAASVGRYVSLLETSGPPPPIYVAWLRIGNPGTLIAHEGVRLKLVPPRDSRDLRLAELKLEGSGCTYRTTSDSKASGGDLLFLRTQGCNTAPPQDGRLKLTLSFATRGAVQLVGHALPAHAAILPEYLEFVGAPGAPPSSTVLAAAYVDDLGGRGLRRIDLLNYVWQVSPDARWIRVCVGIAVCLVALAIAALPTSFESPMAGWRTALSTAMACFAVAAMYGVLVPPFQAPDEPGHFRGYGYVTGNAAIERYVPSWAQLSHFQRIKFNPEEHFRPPDVGHPYPVAWDDASPQDFARSSVTVRLWRALAPVLGPLDIPRQFLLIRLLNCFAFGAIAAVCAGIMCKAGARSASTLLALPLLVPMVPFLGMHVSNYAPAMTAYLMMASGVAILLIDDRHSALSGWLLGPGYALAVASTRSALPMGALLAGVVSLRLVLGSRGATGSRRVTTAAVFWSGLGAGALLLGIALTEWQEVRFDQELAQTIPKAEGIYFALKQHFLLAAAAAVAVGMVLELAGTRLKAAIVARWKAPLAEALTAVSIIVAIGVAASMIGSVVIAFPELHSALNGRRISQQEYIWQAVVSCATMFRLRNHDFLMSTTFWSGLGWQDVILPSLMTALIGCTGLSLITTMLVGRSCPRKQAWQLGISAAALVTVGCYAAVAFRISPDLHGRYLAGLYLCCLYLAWIPAFTGTPASSNWARRGVPWLAAGAHIVSLAAILGRYF